MSASLAHWEAAVIRLFVSGTLARGAAVAVSAEQAHFLGHVMRLKCGDALVVFNGLDGEWDARVEALGKREGRLLVGAGLREQAGGPDLDLLVARVKRSRLETIVEKATELGVRRLRPVITERTNADHPNVGRLRSIAMEAAEQCGRLDLPEIFEPVKLGAALEGWEAGRRLMFCDEAGDAPPVARALASAEQAPWTILIGPEGGFSPAERARIRAMAATAPVSLGPRILRADTAAIAAVTVWQSVLGDWRGA
jgi:16S rRNA (uracil1498-N3)-methyltransferase